MYYLKFYLQSKFYLLLFNHLLIKFNFNFNFHLFQFLDHNNKGIFTMINFELIDLATGADLLSKPFDNTLINFEDSSALIDYAMDLADDVVAATSDMNNPCAIRFYNDGVAFEKTNNAFGMELGNGNLIKDEAGATEYLLTSFFQFLYNDGEDYLNSLPQMEEFGITDQELTSVSNADLLVLGQQTATAENWDINAVKINNPVSLTVSKDQGQFNIRSLFMNNLSNVKVVADLGDTSLVLANLDVNSFDDNDYALKLATESGVYADLDGNKYFVPTEKYAELTNFRLEIDDAKYQALNNIETEWVVSFEPGKAASDQAEIKKNIMMLTNLAYVLQSEEFDSVLDHYEEIAGKKFYMYQRYQDGSKNGSNPTNFTEEQISVDFNNSESRKYFYDVMGVRNATTGGQKGPTASFYFVEEPTEILNGRSMTGGTWYNNQLELGTGIRVTMNEIHSDYHQGNIITPVALHEMGHLFGYHHYSSFCTGEAVDTGERVFYSLIQLMGEAGKLPYYDELPEYNMERVGFNGVEKFIYEHGSEFPDLYKYLDSVKDQRNATYDRLIPEIKKWEQDMSDPFLRMLLLASANYVSPIEQKLHIQDSEAYILFGNTSGYHRIA